MKETPLSVDVLVLDADTQCRCAICEETVETYAELIADNDGQWPLGTLDVFHDGSRYVVADGFHRTLAARRAKRGSVPCRVHAGTAADARMFGMTANDTHGLRMTRADKRRCVEWLLDNYKLPQKQVAEVAGVSTRTVRFVVAERKTAANPPEGERKISATRTGGRQGKDEAEGGSGPAGTEPEGENPQTSRNDTEQLGAFDASDDDVWAAEDKDELTNQRRKAVKTCEALMRAFDDLQRLKPNARHANSIIVCKALLQIIEDWK